MAEEISRVEREKLASALGYLQACPIGSCVPINQVACLTERDWLLINANPHSDREYFKFAGAVYPRYKTEKSVRIFLRLGST